MEKIRYAVIGSGWRSRFYLRLPYVLPFIIARPAVKVRSDAKQLEFSSSFCCDVLRSDEEVIAWKPDFVVVAVDKASLFSVSRRFLEYGIPVLCETPGASTVEELREVVDFHSNIPYGVAEQYFLYPEHQALRRVIESGIIGRPLNLTVSVCHDYHAISLVRKLLGKQSHPRLLSQFEFDEKVKGGFSRNSSKPDWTVRESKRRVALYEFEEGEKVLYDFNSVQYHASDRISHLRIDGEKGSIDNGVVRWYNTSGDLEVDHIDFNDYSSIKFQGSRIYHCPSGTEGLSSEEIAITSLLLNFSAALKRDEELLYPASESALDALSAFGAEFRKEI